MPVRKDPRTGNWFFRTIVKLPDGTRKRIYGVPGVPGDYHDCAQSKVGVLEAERRAIAAALRGAAIDVKKGAWQGKTIEQHAERFVDLYKPETRESEKREKRRVLKADLLPFFGAKTIESLTQHDVDAFALAELKRGMSIKSVNNRLAVLRTLVKHVTGEQPQLSYRLRGPTGEIHAVDSGDVERLLDAADPIHRVVVLLAFEAGLRAAEIRGVQWTDIRDGVITVRRALEKQSNETTPPKHDKVRTVPLSPRLTESLAALPRRGIWIVSVADGGYVTYDILSRNVNALYAKAGVTRPEKPLHCLRHSFGTEMAKRGTPLPVLQQLMGHSDIATTMKYIDVNERQKADAIAAVFGSHVAAKATRPSK